MSNVIKAAAVTYTQEIRTIDSNLREGGFTRLAVEKRAQVKEEAAGEAKFEPGIFGLFANEETNAAPEGGPEQAAQEEIAKKQEEIEARRQEAESILAQAREEAKSIVSEAKAEAEEIRKKARADGTKQGEQKAKKEYDALKAQLEKQVQAAKDAYERQEEELEPAFVNILIQLMKKLTGVLLEEKREIITYLMEQALHEIEPGMTYLVHVAAEDFAAASAQKGELVRDLKEGAVLEIIEDRTMQKGQCIIETDSRIFDCSMDTQLKNLACDLKLLAGSERGLRPDD